MKISTRGRYALRMMVDLAQHWEEGAYIPLKEISARKNISKKYMEQIIPLLNQGKLLKTTKGQHGGYMLACQPSEITVAQIVECAEGGLDIIDFPDPSSPEYEQPDLPLILPVWEGLNACIRDYLAGITLQDILDSQEEDIGTYVI